MMLKAFLEAPTEIVDYGFVMDCLKGLKKPRTKLTSLLRHGDLQRVKKGLYVLGQEYGKGLASLEMLANLIYGPSYLSLEYALSFYGLIPERVEEITSVTCNRKKLFATPFGRFSYHYLPMEKYAVGVSYLRLDAKRGFLIASPEKALIDLVARQKFLREKDSLRAYIEGLRIEEEALGQLNLKKIEQIAKMMRLPQIDQLKKVIYETRERSAE